MRILYFDCFSGISGDMTVAALLSLGIDQEKFTAELAKLHLPGYQIEIQTCKRHGISGIDFNVLVEEHGHVERNLQDITSIIKGSLLSDPIKEFSLQTFQEIARAEAKVHGRRIEEVHFHEVGAVDSIIDIVGTAVCLELLGWPEVASSPLHEGHGFIQCQHGRLPVPVPAVLEMLAGSAIPVICDGPATELVTPTGMALIKTLTREYGPLPSGQVAQVGYGMGKRDTGSLNALRIIAVEAMDAKGEATAGQVVVLETNIDDMPGEQIAYAMDKARELGALDAFTVPIYMKKNRPAFMLKVIARPRDEAGLCELLFKETTTLGIRKYYVERNFMPRTIEEVETPLGKIKVKIASFGSISKASPEYEDCRRIAEATGLPLREIYEEAQMAVKLLHKG